MSVAPEQYRAARLALPRLPLPAILSFAVAGFSGAVFLAYNSFSHAETKHSIAPANDVPVYSARAVPFDPPPEEIAQRAASIARAITATRSEPQRTQPIEADRAGEFSGPTLVAETNSEMKSISRFSHFAGANNYLLITGANFGMSAQMAPSGYAAPDAETATAAPVPETSTWLCGAALLGLIAARGIHASWHRNQRRAAKKTATGRS